VPLGLNPRDVVGLFRDTRQRAASARPIVVSGVLAGELAKQLGAGGEPGAVRVGGNPSGAAAYVLVLAGDPTDADVGLLRAATRAAVPRIAVQTGREPTLSVPYVLATDIVHCPPGRGFPVGEIASALARRLGPDGVGIAARLPALRGAVAERLIADASNASAVIGLLPRGQARFPLPALAQLRLVLDLAAAHGRELGPDRAPEVGAVLGTGLALRTGVRRLGLAGSRIAGGITGYAGTRALGEAAVRRFGAGSSPTQESVRSRS
jgi:uncharacterized protein (DUF697 family)